MAQGGSRRRRARRSWLSAAAGSRVLGNDMRMIAKLLAAAAVAGLGMGDSAAQKGVDVLIKGGTVYTGSDAPFTGDVAISGDHIVAVGPHLTVQAARTIDAHGMIVAPGFIAPHTHMGHDLASTDPQRRLIPMFLMQGVPTAFFGNAGGGAIDVGKVLAAAKARPVGINCATYA